MDKTLKFQRLPYYTMRNSGARAVFFPPKSQKRPKRWSQALPLSQIALPVNAYFRGFYDEMIDFIRSLFESALKTNPYLEKSVITGCLRISKESIFTGLNNLETDSVLHTRFGDSFGFTQEEVEGLLAYYDLSEQLEEVKKWYDGYLFNDFEIYNPWSILKYVNDRKDHVTEFALPYWSNTSSNSIVREMVGEADGRQQSLAGNEDSKHRNCNDI